MIEHLQRVLVHQFNVVIDVAADTAPLACPALLPEWLQTASAVALQSLDMKTSVAVELERTSDGPSESVSSSARYITSSSEASLPHVDRLQAGGRTITGVTVASDIAGVVQNLQKALEICRTDAVIRKVEEAQECWRLLETGYLGRIADDLRAALMGSVFPVNRFTRRRADFVGSTLSTRGLIRYEGCDCR